MSTALGLTPYPPNTAPQAYDIVYGCFPFEEDPGEPGKPRPCLVLSTKLIDGDVPYVVLQVAYGTSKITRSLERYNRVDYLRVHNYEALDRAGLSKDTLFVLARIKRLMWSQEWFPTIPNFGTPIMGRLTEAHITELQLLREIRASR